jgi:hypothetical protein
MFRCFIFSFWDGSPELELLIHILVAMPILPHILNKVIFFLKYEAKNSYFWKKKVWEGRGDVE